MATYPPRGAVLLMGPTGTGKTALAMELASRGPFQIISVDSTMVYRGLDIGAAKPGRAELTRTPHRLIDIREPNEPYSAADFREDALREIAEIRALGAIPLLVGGTGLYFRALCQGLSDMPPADPSIREALRKEGVERLHERLQAIDPEAAKRIHPNDPQRLIRALEIHAQSGRTQSSFFAQGERSGLPGPLYRFVLAPEDRMAFHAHLAQRFQGMLAAGFVEEVEGLRARGDLDESLPSMRGVGYREIWRYLDGRITRREMEERGVISTRQLAKRQITWFRSEPEATWLDWKDKALFAKVYASIASLA